MTDCSFWKICIIVFLMHTKSGLRAVKCDLPFVAVSDSEVYACTVDLLSPGLWLDEWFRSVHEECIKSGKKHFCDQSNKLWITKTWLVFSSFSLCSYLFVNHSPAARDLHILLFSKLAVYCLNNYVIILFVAYLKSSWKKCLLSLQWTRKKWKRDIPWSRKW